jgi:hypothetical protein
MDVIFPADGARIAQPIGDLFHHGIDVFLRFFFRRTRFQFGQQPQGVDGSGPGPEVFGREFHPRHFLQVAIDHARIDAAVLAGFVVILEQFLSGNVATGFYLSRQPSVADGDIVVNPFFTFETKLNSAGAYVDVFVL